MELLDSLSVLLHSGIVHKIVLHSTLGLMVLPIPIPTYARVEGNYKNQETACVLMCRELFVLGKCTRKFEMGEIMINLSLHGCRYCSSDPVEKFLGLTSYDIVVKLLNSILDLTKLN